jgi:hypothetical protein
MPPAGKPSQGMEFLWRRAPGQTTTRGPRRQPRPEAVHLLLCRYTIPNARYGLPWQTHFVCALRDRR